MTTLTDAQIDACQSAMRELHRERMESIARMASIRFADEETTFESCAYFYEECPDGRGTIIDLHSSLTNRLKTRLDRACRERMMQPGAIRELLHDTKKKYGRGTYLESVAAFNHLDNHLLVAETLKKDYPEITSLDPYSVGRLISSVLKGLPYRRVVSDRKPVNNLLSENDGKFAAATVYIIALDSNEEPGVHREILFKDSNGTEQYGTALKNQTTVELLRTHPEKVFGVVDSILERGALG